MIAYSLPYYATIPTFCDTTVYPTNIVDDYPIFGVAPKMKLLHDTSFKVVAEQSDKRVRKDNGIELSFRLSTLRTGVSKMANCITLHLQQYLFEILEILLKRAFRRLLRQCCNEFYQLLPVKTSFHS